MVEGVVEEVEVEVEVEGVEEMVVTVMMGVEWVVEVNWWRDGMIGRMKCC